MWTPAPQDQNRVIYAKSSVEKARLIIFMPSKKAQKTYKYTEFDTDFIRQRNAQFRAQIAHRLDGSLTEEEFKPLRLMNGL